jgi:hypothetical protein
MKRKLLVAGLFGALTIGGVGLAVGTASADTQANILLKQIRGPNFWAANAACSEQRDRDNATSSNGFYEYCSDVGPVIMPDGHPEYAFNLWVHTPSY